MGEAVAWRGFAGFGLEGTEGTGVKSVYKVDLLSESLQGQGEPIIVPIINQSRMDDKVVMGPYESAGDISVAVTPDIFTTLLYSTLTSLASAGTSAPYTHVFKTGSTLKALTAQIQRGDFYHVYPGLKVARLSFKAVVDAILQATISFGGRAKEKVYNSENSDAGVVYSSNDPFVFLQGALTLHGSSDVLTNDWDVNIDTGLLRNRAIGSGRAHNRAFAGRSRISGSFNRLFEDIEAHRRWMGASSSSYPISVGDAVQFAQAVLLFTASASLTLQIDIPKLYYKASGPALENADGTVMQRCSFGAKKDSSSGSDIVVTVVNSEANAAITTNGTAIP